MIENYEKYLEFISEKINGFFERQKPYIKCRKGCAKCCKNAEFPYSFIEFKYLLSGFLTLDKEIQDIIEAQILAVVEAKKKFQGEKFLYDCPFLINDVCSVYPYRGIVCRTFGLIIQKKENETANKVPFCIHEGLNYSMVLDEEKNIISEKKYKELGISEAPLGFNISHKFLTDIAFEKKYNFEFGEKKTLIDWFENKEKKQD